MKVYIIYKVRNRNNMTIDVPELYAFSTDKKLIDEFMKERKMKYFFVKEKDIGKKLYIKFQDKYNRKKLAYQPLYTRNEINPNTKRTIRVLGTWDEIEDSAMRSDYKIFEELARYVSPDVFALKTEYIKALETLYYLEVCRFSWMQEFPIGVRYLFDGLMGDNRSEYDEKEIVRTNLEYDEFAFYMYFYGWMYK